MNKLIIFLFAAMLIASCSSIKINEADRSQEFLGEDQIRSEEGH